MTAMETKKSKYDTNPLDEDVAQEAEEAWGDSERHAGTQEVKRGTSPVAQPQSDPRANVYSEAPTRRYDNPPLDAPYPSIFVPPTYAPPSEVYQPPPELQRPPAPEDLSRTVPGIGVPEKWARMLPYAPFYVGIIVSLVELFLVPRREVKVRFHAAQGLSLHIAILVFDTLFRVLGSITDSSIGGILFNIAVTIFLVISMIRTWKGEPHRIAPLAEPTQWFNEKIEPRK